VNVNIFINRVKPYNPSGRNQTLEEAIAKDEDIYKLLNKYSIDYTYVDGDEDAARDITKHILGMLNVEKTETITVPMSRESLLELTQVGKEESFQFISDINKIPVNDIVSVTVLQEAGVQPMVHIKYKI
jgi:hypothetical protein